MTPRRRPAPRGTLTREAILDAAFDFVARDGLDGFSMPRLASRMGVGVASIYWHVANRDELLEAVAGRVLDLVTTAEGDPTSDRWDDLLTAHFRAVRRILDRYPGFGELVLGHGFPPGEVEVVGPANPRIQAMVEAGMTPEAAAQGFLAAAVYTLGYATWTAATAGKTTGARPSDDGYELGLRALVTGLAATIA